MLEMEIIEPNILEMEISGQIPSTIGGTTNYNELSSKPKINGIELKGDKSLDEFNIASKDYVEQEIATFDFIKIVQQLPTTGLPNRTYLVSKTNATDNDLYDEYIWINKGTEEEPNWDWEFLGTKKIEVDLTNYVKNTDYAIRDGSHGIVKISAPFGIDLPNGASSPIAINMATNEQIDAKTSAYRPIVPSNLDYAIKKGLSNNTLEWTDEEKTNARNVINAQKKIPDASGGVAAARIVDPDGNINMGIYSRGSAYTEKLLCGSANGWGLIENSQITRTQLEKQLGDYDEEKASLQSQIDNKVDIPTTPTTPTVVTMDANGNIGTLRYTASPVAYTVMQRGVGGVVEVGTPTADKHATNKAYVDGGFIGKDTNKSTYHQVYGKSADGTNQWLVDYTTGAIANTLAQRGVGGVLKVGTPIDDGDATTKKYVDDLIAQLREELGLTTE